MRRDRVGQGIQLAIDGTGLNSSWEIVIKILLADIGVQRFQGAHGCQFKGHVGRLLNDVWRVAAGDGDNGLILDIAEPELDIINL